ncbi:hypothetical protein V5E97_29060 [Singulisphaera sp. Ch08]|uniref:SMP domain-containing protein n=1 Tax=Singulisphaera sp. Ch08 TaxID=3120278 RepID=A0AAU7CB28_9BACT
MGKASSPSAQSARRNGSTIAIQSKTGSESAKSTGGMNTSKATPGPSQTG